MFFKISIFSLKLLPKNFKIFKDDYDDFIILENID